MLQLLSFRSVGGCLKSNGTSMTNEELSKKFSKYGEVLLAVVNLCFKNNRNNNTNKASSSTNRLKSYRNTTGAFTVGNMSTTFMQGRAIFNTFKLKMRKLENNWKSSQGKQLWKKLNFKSKLLEQNSMSLLQIFIIWRQPKPSRGCIILLTHN